MAIVSIDEMPVLSCSVVDFWPSTNDRYEGILVVGKNCFETSVVDEDDPRRLCVLIRIASDISDERKRDAATLTIAKRSLSEQRWRYLSVDPRDGEVVYGTTFTCDFSVAALDKFLYDARDFLDEHAGEIETLIESSCSRFSGLALGEVSTGDFF